MLSRAAKISLGYLAVAGLWILLSDTLVAWLVTQPEMLIRVQSWKGAAFVLTTGLILYALLRNYAAVEHPPIEMAPPDRLRAVLLGLTFFFLAALAVGFGSLFYERQAATHKDHQYRQQAAIAELKAAQIERWFDWHLQEAVQLSGDPDLLDDLRKGANTLSGRQAGRIGLHFENLMKSGRWAGIGIHAADGRVLLRTGRTNAPDDGLLQMVAAALANARPALNDLHSPGRDEYAIDFIAPVSPEWALVLSADPRASLFAMATSWPIPSETSETLLVRREAEEVVHISPLRHSDRKPLDLRMPLTDADLPSVRAVVEGEGIYEGVDYRGVPVLAAYRPVAGTPWHIVAKTDTEEVMRPLRQQAHMILAAVVFAIGLSALFVILLWRGQLAAHTARELRNRQALAALDSRFTSLFQQARDSILLIDPDGRIVEANDAALAAYGYTAEAIRQVNIRDLHAPEAQAGFERDFEAAGRPEGVLFETLHRRKDGSVFPVEVSARPFRTGGTTYRQSVVRDIAARKRAEEENRRQLVELRRWFEATLNREDRIAELKSEVNALRQRLDEPPRYAGRPSAAGDASVPSGDAPARS